MSQSRGSTHSPRLKSLAERLANTAFGTWFLVNIGTHLDRVLLEWSSGRLSISGFAAPNLLLFTTGARSGKRRSVPMLYAKNGKDFVVVASNGGSTRFPAWFHNLRADPSAEVIAEGRRVLVTAREAVGVEYDCLWRTVNEMYCGYEGYREKASGRRIPLVVLESDADFRMDEASLRSANIGPHR